MTQVVTPGVANVNASRMKALHLLSVLSQNPREFMERLVTISEGRLELLRNRPEYKVTPREQALAALGATIGAELRKHLDEVQFAQIECKVGALRQSITADGPFSVVHNADPIFAYLCYALVRALRPKLVVETGVCYGVTSAYVLQALSVNGDGRLHSIDLPPLGKNGDDYVGWFVPEELRSRWTLHRGQSSRLLPPLLAGVDTIDLFIHDSLHTYRNMTHEFRLAWAALRAGGVLVSDDIEGNSAFAELAAAADVLCSVVMPQGNKGALLGVAVKRG